MGGGGGAQCAPLGFIGLSIYHQSGTSEIYSKLFVYVYEHTPVASIKEMKKKWKEKFR